MNKIKEKVSEKHRIHQVYKLKDGTIVPGGSTIAGMLDKGGGLIGSAVKLTKAGFDYRKVWDEKAEVGTVAHGRILHDLKGIAFDLSDYSQKVIQQSDWSMKSYYNWKSQHSIIPRLCEEQFVSETMKSGGTMDYVGMVDNSLVLTDYKSGGLWESAYVQISGYDLILQENGIIVDKLLLLNIPRNEDDNFKDVYLTDKEREIYGRIFKNLCKIYWDRNEVKK